MQIEALLKSDAAVHGGERSSREGSGAEAFERALQAQVGYAQPGPAGDGSRQGGEKVSSLPVDGGAAKLGKVAAEAGESEEAEALMGDELGELLLKLAEGGGGEGEEALVGLEMLRWVLGEAGVEGESGGDGRSVELLLERLIGAGGSAAGPGVLPEAVGEGVGASGRQMEAGGQAGESSRLAALLSGLVDRQGGEPGSLWVESAERGKGGGLAGGHPLLVGLLNRSAGGGGGVVSSPGVGGDGRGAVDPGQLMKQAGGMSSVSEARPELSRLVEAIGQSQGSTGLSSGGGTGGGFGGVTSLSGSVGEGSTLWQLADREGMNTARLARGLRSAVLQDGGSLRVRLSPPELGTVRVDVRVQSGQVSANLQTQSESARALLSQQVGQLRQALESQGMQVERLTIQTISPSSQAGGSGAQQQQGEGSNGEGRSRDEYTQQQGRERGGGEQDGRQGSGSDFASYIEWLSEEADREEEAGDVTEVKGAI